MLDSQIGTVVMPYDGYLTAAVYDSNGQIVRTLLAQFPEQAGSVPLMWDGKDQVGRTVSQDGTYTWKALTSQVNPVDEGSVGDTEAVPDKGAPNQGYNVQSLATSTIAGLAGDVGGTFTRRGDSESYFGDTTLSQNYSLSSTISASGRLFFSDTVNMSGVAAFIGHFSSSTLDDKREFIGLEFQHTDANESVTVRARIYPFNGNYFGGAISGDVLLPAHTGYYNWDYSYDPNYEADATHAGPEGQLTVHIYNNAGVNQTLYAVNTGAMRDAGSTFDAFGMGISKLEPNFGNNAALTGKIFMDDVSYSGNMGVVDFTGNPGWVGSANTSDGNNFGWNSYSNADSSLYTASFLEESQEPVAKVGADGSWQWGIGAQLSIGVAADETYAYYTQHISGQDRLYRVFNRDGGAAPFAPGVNYLLVNASSPDPTSDPTILPNISVYHYNAEQWRTYFGTSWGIAADGYRIWVSDYRNNRVLVYDRATGASLGQFAITKPLGIAVDTATSGSSTVWVANNGNSLTKLTFTNGSFTASTTITGLSDPSGVAIGGTSHHLFVAESGLTRINEYDISGTPTLAGLQHFGSPSSGGTLANNQFYWSPTFGRLGAIAIDPSGILSVLDGQRIQRFYTTTAGGHTAGDLQDSLFSEFAPTPSQTYNYTSGGKHYMVSGRYVYEVDPDYTGGPRAGWLGDGSWRIAERYNFGIGEDTGGPGLYRTLMDGATPRNLFYYLNGFATIYSLEGGTQRQAAIVGANWAGPERNLVVPQNEAGLRLGGTYNWTDTDGDGVVDWNGALSGTDSAGEVVWNIPFGQYNHLVYTAPWVDDAGNIWYADDTRNLIKIPLEAFADTTNGKRNPVYNWAHKQVVIPFQDDAYDFSPFQVRIAGNGDIYALGFTNTPAGTYQGANGTQWVAIYNSSGVRQYLAPTIDNYFVGLAIDPNDSDPDYYFTGETQWASMFTKDGLLVARFTTDGASGAPTGWMDQPHSITAFTHPTTGKLYVYGEEVFYGKSTRWRIDNTSTIQRQQANFTYTATTAPGGHWELDNNLNDAAGNNPGTITGGTASYAAGQVGNAIDLDGVDDYVTLPYSSNVSGSYTISAWVRPTDTSFVNIVSRGSANPVDYSHQIRLNSAGKFEHYTYDGGPKTITGTTIAVTNSWYHVAITATSNGMIRLYVNGVEEGTAQSVSALWSGGDRFHVGRSNGGGGFFDGLIDDVRIYENALSQSDIQAIYNKTVKPNITVTASDATAAEQATDPGKFLIRRDNTSGNLVVNYTITGTATNSSDYATIVGSVTIPSGSSSVVIAVTPIDDAAVDANETVILTISSNANYTVGAPNSATVKIVDNDSTTVSANGYWPFENTLPAWGNGQQFGLSDYVGSNNGLNHGTTFFDYPPPITYDGRATYATGQIGKAVSLDGADDRISIPYANDASAYTIVGWVKPSSVFWYAPTSITSQNIIARSDVDNFTPTNVSEQIRINGAGKFEHYTNDGTGHTVTGTTTVQPNTWYHVAITATSNGQMRLYVNGVEEGTAQSIGNLWTGGDRFQVASFAGGMGPFKGLLDDLQIYDAQLTISQIQAIYNQAFTVTVNTTDAIAAEQGSGPGMYTFIRAGSTGNLTVLYTLSGTGTGPDYSALPSSVTILDGQTSATITVTPIDDNLPEGDETVVLTISPNIAYFVGTPNNATVTIVDNDTLGGVNFSSNPGWTGSNRTTQGNNYGWSPATNQAGGTTGEAGGTFARAVADSYYADTFLSQSFTLNNTISASGKFDVLNLTSGWTGTGNSGLFIGHFATSTSNKEFIGLELKNDAGGLTNQMQVRARLQLPGGTGTAFSAWTNVSTNGNHTFSYTYNPSLGANGRLTLNVDAQSALTVDLSIGDRTSGSLFNAFGLGFANNLNSENDPAKTAQVYLDDVSYSGYRPTVTVAATDSNASEVGNNTGTFTFTRTNANGDLVINYLVAGTATTATDYSALPSSVTILHGQTSATVTVIPLNDITAEVNETVILTLISGGGYYLGTPYNAAVSIADNDTIVSVIATDSSASETGPDPGTYTITRNTSSGSLVINYTLSGTATNISDYSSLSSSVTIPNGQTSATVVVSPIDDSLVEGNETIILTINSDANYTIGAPNNATVTIADNEPIVTVTATDPNAAEPNDTGTFTITRTTTSGNVVVNYTISGTATSGSDFSALAGSVTIPAGSSTVTVTATPIEDSSFEGNETVILTINSSASYSAGTPNSATVTIADNDTLAVTGRWQFENNLNDSAGTNHGTFSGGTPVYAPGKIGQALNMDGVDDDVETPYANNASAITMSAWIKPTSLAISLSVMSRGSSDPLAGSNMLTISSATGKFQYFIYATDGNHTVTGTTTVQVNTWYHVAIVATNNGQMRLYVNGVEEGTAQNIATMWASADRLRVGHAYGWLGYGSFSGLIDDVRVYEQALSPSELSAVYQSHAFADDGFESGNASGGNGWGGSWSFTGNASIVNTGTPQAGTYHLQLTGNNGVASRAVNLAGATNAYLIFDWKANSFEVGETAVVEIYNGTSWINVLTISDGQDDNAYHHAEINLSSYALTSGFQVRFRSLMSATDDFLYIDNLLVSL